MGTLNKTMHYDNKWWGYALGAAGGTFHYLLKINIPTDFYIKLLQAGFTAFVCGILGALGRWAVEKITNYKKKK
jgi:hypothetical protein